MSGAELRAGASRRGTMRWLRLALVVVLVVATSTQIAPTPVDAKLAATLALTGFEDLVLDEPGQHIFVSQGLGQDGVVVTDLAGTPVATITNMPSPRRMALSYDGTKVYVPLYTAHQIAVVSTTTLAVTDRFDLSINVCPSSVAPTANGLLAIGNGCPGNGFSGIGVLNLATRVYNTAPADGPFYSPVVAASVGSGALFVAGDLGLSPTTLFVYSSAGGTPTLLASRLLLDTGNLNSLAVNPAGTRVVVAAGGPYVHRSYSLPDLADATDYVSTNYPGSVAWSADGSTVVTGTYSSLGPDLRFNDAATGAIRRQVIVGEPLIVNSVDVSSDGRTAYAVTYGGPFWQFHLYVIGPNVEGALLLDPPVSTYVGEPMQFAGSLTFDNIGVGNLTLNVERAVAGSPFTPIGSSTTNSDGRFSVIDVPAQTGQTSYRVTSVGAPGFPSQTQTTTLTVLTLPAGAMSLGAPATATVGQLVDLTGSLTFGGQAISGLQVTVQRVWNGVITTVGVAFTAPDGTFHIQDLPLNVGATTYIATSQGTGPFTSQSASTSVVVAPNDLVPPVVIPSGTFPLDPPLSPDTPTLFSPLVPPRLLDTRAGASTFDGLGRPAKPLAPADTMNLQVLGRGGVPSTGVSAVVLNVTVASPSAPSFLTIWPSGTGRPSASNLNFVAGQIVPNLVVAKVGVAGNVSIFNLSGSVDVIADVAGYFPDSDGFVPLVPARLLDTRPDLPTIDGLGRPGAPIGPSQSIDVQVINRGGVPSGGVDSVVLNVTATNPTANSFLTVWPAGQPRPVASNLNTVPGQTVPNLVVAKVGASGNVSIYNLAGSVDVIVDIAGYFPIGGSFVALQPARLMETRPGETVAPGATNKGTPLGAGQTFDLAVTGIGGVPASRVSAVVLNVTAVHPSGPSFVTVWPTGVPRPNASNLNLTGIGQVVPNLVVARVGAGGKVSIFNLSGNTDLIVDVAGYFVEEPTSLPRHRVERHVDMLARLARSLRMLGSYGLR